MEKLYIYVYFATVLCVGLVGNSPGRLGWIVIGNSPCGKVSFELNINLHMLRRIEKTAYVLESRSFSFFYFSSNSIPQK